jgi:hypothetical protein
MAAFLLFKLCKNYTFYYIGFQYNAIYLFKQSVNFTHFSIAGFGNSCIFA